jgi:hypothetical protein
MTSDYEMYALRELFIGWQLERADKCCFLRFLVPVAFSSISDWVECLFVILSHEYASPRGYASDLHVGSLEDMLDVSARVIDQNLSETGYDVEKLDELPDDVRDSTKRCLSRVA